MTARLGATVLGEDRLAFLVWAPRARRVDVVLDEGGGRERVVPLSPLPRGYHRAEVEAPDADAPEGDAARYRYRLDGERDLPDPASRSQPEGVHGPSAVVDPSRFRWTDEGWCGLPLPDYVVYEIHVGTFTPEGTFDAVVPRLEALADLGVTAVEIMPVAQFPGARNWGYDGVYPYAVQDSYGGPDGLARLVDACHARGLAVVLDVVYNHLGPEGNYLREFAPYFTDRYRTPWGEAVNFDGEGSDEVRRYFVGNALHWIEDYHVDALRLDAVHGIVDTSARPFLAQLADEVGAAAARLGRRVHLIAESDLGDPRILAPRAFNGMGMDAQWSDDFHHAVHTLLTRESSGYYADFGSVGHLVRALRDGYTYTGQYSVARRRSHGAPPRHAPGHAFVVCVQNHDQVGNRMRGERLSALVPFEGLRVAAGAMLLAPFVPLLFMGEEYGEVSPFQYFVSHSDPDLVEAVRRGRKEEFAAFGWEEEPPDPQDESTFERSRLDHGLAEREPNAGLRRLYAELLSLRREVPALRRPSRDQMDVSGDERRRTLTLRRWSAEDEALALFNFGDEPAPVALPPAPCRWERRLDSEDAAWGGSGADTPPAVGEEGGDLTLPGWSFALYARPREPGEA